ncbi:YqcC family protein [Flocculibacter collagenilyticus]|uniref:YqcC family protein n=1 Tax=Flocculibacter collagenilyticus TaxID=2744479 RepID=UPI0018F517B8|nr:YqcC family protein [Flocculibacter collagenilyticus]
MKHQQTANLLIQLTEELNALKLWQSTPPTQEALRSQQPFCYDTLRFEQWLQFIFIPRMTMLVEQKQPLPTSIAIAPMAEETEHLKEYSSLILICRQFDELLGK